MEFLGRTSPTGPSSLSATPSSAIGHAREAAASLGWCQWREGDSKGEEGAVMDTCAR